MYIVITGSPVNGFIYHGIFKDEQAAAVWAKRNIYVNWWIAKVHSAA
jgi:hypothetical protein